LEEAIMRKKTLAAACLVAAVAGFSAAAPDQVVALLTAAVQPDTRPSYDGPPMGMPGGGPNAASLFAALTH
jgi:hypothetical protein